MLTRLILTLAFLSGLVYASSQSCSEAEIAYGEFLKFDYCTSAEQLEKGSLSHTMMLMLCQAGQIPEPVQLSFLIRTPCDSTMVLLLQGYDSLYNRRGSVASLQHFMHAYDQSRSLGGELHKLVLLAIQEFYSGLLYSDQQNQDQYLEEYRTLAPADQEVAIALYYESEQWSKSTRLYAWDSLKVLSRRFERELRAIDSGSNLHILSRSVRALILRRDEYLNEAEQEHQQIIFECKDKPYLQPLVARSTHQLIYIKTEQHKYSEALKYADDLKGFANSIDSSRILFAIHRRKAAIYHELNQSALAYMHLNRATKHQLATNYQTLGMQSAALEVQLGTIEKEKDLLEAENEVEAGKRLRTTYLAIVSLLALAILFILYRYRINHLERKQFETALENEQQRSQLQAINSKIDGEEAQRFKIAEYLHDHVAGSLAALEVHLDVSERNQAAKLDRPRELVKEVGADIRRLSHELFPTILLHRTLSEALQELCEKYSSEKLRISFVGEVKGLEVSQDARVKLYYVVMELLNNVLKHSDARDAMVKLSATMKDIVIQVRDDGLGFAPDQNEGMGLGMIRARIYSLEGELTVVGKEGCAVTAIVPKARLVDT